MWLVGTWVVCMGNKYWYKQTVQITRWQDLRHTTPLQQVNFVPEDPDYVSALEDLLWRKHFKSIFKLIERNWLREISYVLVKITGGYLAK